VFAVTPSAVIIITIAETGAAALTERSVVAAKKQSHYQGGHFMGCVIDIATRSLVVCDYYGHTISRIRGLDVGSS
jgi:hypothetical protein